MDLVLIHAASSATEGLLLKSRLENEDIPVFTKGEIEGPYRFGPIYLWVPADLEVQARLVLAEILGGGMALGEDEDVAPHVHGGEHTGPGGGREAEPPDD